jgi:hypothetical protein
MIRPSLRNAPLPESPMIERSAVGYVRARYSGALRRTLGAGLVAYAATATHASATELSEAAPPPTTSGDVTTAYAVRRARRPFALDLNAATFIPLSVGPELDLELPGRVLAQVHLGWMPELYSRTLTGALQDAGVYDDAVGALIDGALESATTWRLAAGWRPFDGLGLELTLGYVHVSLAGSTSSGEIAPLVSADLAERLISEIGNTGIHVDSQLHHVTAALGWRWLIAKRFVIVANVGYLQAFASNSSLRIDGFAELTRLAAPTVDAVLHDYYMRYIKVPVVGIALGYRFF